MLECCDVLLVTVTDRETAAMKRGLDAVAEHEPSTYYGERQTYTDYGYIGGARIVQVRSEMGTASPGGSGSTVADAIVELAPRAIIMVGVAFGFGGRKLRIGTVLVSKQLQDYESWRIGDPGQFRGSKNVSRGDRASASARLLDRFRDAAETWEANDNVVFGLMLSGDKLVDNLAYRNSLESAFPEALGGEMEGRGLYKEAKDRAEWILVKAVCDWADGSKRARKSSNQGKAARAAADFVVHALGLGGFESPGTARRTPQLLRGRFRQRPIDDVARQGLQAKSLSRGNPNSELHDLRAWLQHRRVQVALDVADMDRALRLAGIAAESGADLLEVGDPLIKRFGMNAVQRIRVQQPDARLVAEFSSSDWVDEQVCAAADAGASMVLLLGLRTAVRIERAVHAARTKKVGVVLEVPYGEKIATWCQMAEECGVDGLAVIRNIDSSTSPVDAWRRARSIRRHSALPIAVSGGFSPSNIAEARNEPWNVVIVGRAVVNSPDPASVVRSLVSLVHLSKD